VVQIPTPRKRMNNAPGRKIPDAANMLRSKSTSFYPYGQAQYRCACRKANARTGFSDFVGSSRDILEQYVKCTYGQYPRI
jgi:hypothetical protein